MLSLTRVASLDISAASGLVVIDDRLHVIADDETFLSVYALDGSPRERIPLLSGTLPAGKDERKRRKPDFEALALLPGGRLLALGSGSTAARMRGALVDLRNRAVRALDLRPLYERLGSELRDLNLEGATVSEGTLWLLQRGNGPSGVNATVELELVRALAGLDDRNALEPEALRSLQRIELGELHGVPLGFTDAATLPSGDLLFSAVAEDTPDSYRDGPCSGAILGVLENGRVARKLEVSPPCKLEGVALASSHGPALELWLVADPDDRAQPATLYRAQILL